VTLADSWPSIRCSARGFTLADAASDAHMCRRSCRVTCSTPAHARRNRRRQASELVPELGIPNEDLEAID
jgi:hypothetical protein